VEVAEVEDEGVEGAEVVVGGESGAGAGAEEAAGCGVVFHEGGEVEAGAEGGGGVVVEGAQEGVAAGEGVAVAGGGRKAQAAEISDGFGVAVEVAGFYRAVRDAGDAGSCSFATEEGVGVASFDTERIQPGGRAPEVDTDGAWHVGGFTKGAQIGVVGRGGEGEMVAVCGHWEGGRRKLRIKN
jgi:hypothetical protein